MIDDDNECWMQVEAPEPEVQSHKFTFSFAAGDGPGDVDFPVAGASPVPTVSSIEMPKEERRAAPTVPVQTYAPLNCFLCVDYYFFDSIFIDFKNKNF